MLSYSRRATVLVLIATVLATEAAGDSPRLSLVATGRIRRAPQWSIEEGSNPHRIVFPLEGVDPDNPSVVNSRKIRFALTGATFPAHFSTSMPASCKQGGAKIPDRDIRMVLDGQVRQGSQGMTLHDERIHSISIQIQVSHGSDTSSGLPILCREAGGLTVTY